MWSCAIPHPKVVQSIPCTCGALEYQLHLGGYKQRTSPLDSGIRNSTCVPSREEEGAEEKVTLLAKLVDLTCMFSLNTMLVYSERSVVGGDLSRPQVLVGFSRVVLYQQSSFVSWLLCTQFLTQSGCHHDCTGIGIPTAQARVKLSFGIPAIVSTRTYRYPVGSY